MASLFRGVPKDLFDTKIANLFFDLQKEWGGVPFDVVNDGEVTALAGAMSLNDSAVLGIALGSSEAGGYVTPNGEITTWLNELAFCPVDYDPNGAVDEWSGDRGCGAQYFSQQAVFRLAPAAGIEIDESLGLAEKLKSVQDLLQAGDERALQDLGDHRHLHGLRRRALRATSTTSARADPRPGDLAATAATSSSTRRSEVLKTEFPELAEQDRAAPAGRVQPAQSARPSPPPACLYRVKLVYHSLKSREDGAVGRGG